MKTILATAIVTSLAFCGGCATLQDLTSAVMDVNAFTTEEEKQFGQQVSGQIESEVKLVTDAAVNSYVSEVGARVAAKSPRQDLTYQFKVIDSPDEVNAFAVPGGFIYVYTGLLKKMDDESELAGVLAHEVGHVAEKHSMEQITREMGFDYISKMLLGENTEGLAATATGLVKGLGFLHFSRAQESESDIFAINLMAQTGDNPKGLVTFLEKLVEMQTAEPAGVERLLLTHPAPSVRLAATRAEIERLGLKTNQPAKPIPAYVKK